MTDHDRLQRHHPVRATPTEETGTTGRRATLTVPLPQRITLSGTTATIGSGALAAAIASGHAPTDPVQVGALVVLSLAAMAYDIARKALRLRGA